MYIINVKTFVGAIDKINIAPIIIPINIKNRILPLLKINIEYNIKEIKSKINIIIENLKVFEVGDSEIELKTMLDYFNTTQFELMDRYDLVIDLVSTATTKPEMYGLNGIRYETDNIST